MTADDARVKAGMIAHADPNVPVHIFTTPPSVCTTANGAQQVGGTASTFDVVNTKVTNTGKTLSVHDFDLHYAWCVANMLASTSVLKTCVHSTIAAKCHATTDSTADPTKDFGCTVDHVVQCSSAVPQKQDLDVDGCKCAQFAMGKVAGVTMNGKCSGLLSTTKKRGAHQTTTTLSSMTTNTNSNSNGGSTSGTTGSDRIVVFGAGAIVGVVVGAVAVIIVIVVLVVVLSRRDGGQDELS
jgi:hypothetical protein